MKQALFILAAAAAAILGLGADPASAQATRTFVSGHGSDANPCSLSAPCRSFQHAHDTVNPSGEVVALDAAGYGPLTISKAVTITAIGIEASITTNSTTPTGIVINAGPTDSVTLRGITLFSGTNTGDGIDINAAKSVTISDCSISGFPGDGINIAPSANLNVELRGVSADNNTVNGLNIAPAGSGTVAVLATDSHFGGNGFDGVFVSGQGSTGTITATLSVVASANGNGVGVLVISAGGQAQPVVMVTGSKLVNNSIGLIGNINARVLVDRTQISGNGTGWEALNSAQVTSYKNNEVNGNGTDGFNGVTQITTE